jgi:hypothetical protein
MQTKCFLFSLFKYMVTMAVSRKSTGTSGNGSNILKILLYCLKYDASVKHGRNDSKVKASCVDDGRRWRLLRLSSA